MRALPLVLCLSAALAGCAAVAPAPSGGTRAGSVIHGFAFTVPAPLEVRARSPEALSVGQGAGRSFAAAADLRLTEAAEGGLMGAPLAALRAACAADGASCGAVERFRDYRNPAGLQGATFYLSRTREGAALDAWGPVYLLDVSDREPGPGVAALSVQPPAGLTASEVNQPLLRALADRLTMEEPEAAGS